MGELFDVSTLAKRVRLFGILEVFGWVLLFIGMYFKHGVTPSVGWPLMVFGMVHGIIFLAFAFSLLMAWREFEWSGKTIGLGLLSTVIPFCSVWFERWAIRSGQLGELSAAAAPAAAGS